MIKNGQEWMSPETIQPSGAAVIPYNDDSNLVLLRGNEKKRERIEMKYWFILTVTTLSLAWSPAVRPATLTDSVSIMGPAVIETATILPIPELRITIEDIGEPVLIDWQTEGAADGASTFVAVNIKNQTGLTLTSVEVGMGEKLQGAFASSAAIALGAPTLFIGGIQPPIPVEPGKWRYEGLFWPSNSTANLSGLYVIPAPPAGSSRGSFAFHIAAVPEPGAAVVLGLPALLMLRRR
ncbi:MAG: hypothetical protein AAGJ38_02855 [Planctomycetota bacterium]